MRYGQFLGVAVAAAVSMVGAVAAKAQQPATPVKFAVDWAFQGQHGIFALGIERGYYKREGLDVRLDRGYGSGDTIMKVAAGTYDIGFADINGLIKFNAENPNQRLLAFYQVFDSTPNAIITLAKTGIKSPSDLAGKKIAAPEADSSRMMFPSFAKATNLDPASIKWTTVAPNLRETVLVQGQVDAISGFTSTSFFNLVAAGVPRASIVTLPYADYGLGLYGHVLLARPDYAKAHPEVLKGFIRATVAGTKDIVKDPAPAMAALKSRDALFDEALETERLDLLLKTAILTADVAKNGLGTVDPERMRRTITVNAEAMGTTAPPADQIYTTDFLPPASERQVPAPR